MPDEGWMKVILLVIRLLVEIMLGLACIFALTQRFPLLVLGFLGMPRRYQPGDLQRLHVLLSGADVLWVVINFTLGVICVIDVFRIIRTLRTNHSET